MIPARETGTEEAILADLLRRSGRFDEVPFLCRRGMKNASSDVLRKVLAFQMSLAARRDRERHCIEEAIDADL